jgi:cell division inhibitor SulA
MALSGEMHDRTGPLLIENPTNQSAIRDVSMHEAVPVVMRNRSQILKVPGIRQLVKNSHWQTLLCQPLQYKAGAYEAGPACYQNG